MSRLQADLLLLLAAAIWGLAFFYQKVAMDHLGPTTFLAARSFVASLALLPLAFVEGRRLGAVMPPPGLVRIALAGGVLFFTAGWLQQLGLVTATVTNTGFLTCLYVLFTPFIVWAVSGEKPPRAVAIAVLLATAGAWALGSGSLAGFSFGDAVVVAGAVFWSGHMVVTGRSAVHGRPCAYTCLQFATVGVLGLIGASLFETFEPAALLAAWQPILYVGFLSSALTFTLLAIAMKHTPPSEAAILVSLETVFAAIAGALLLGERLSLLGWVGAAAMLAAILVVQLGAQRTAKS